VPFLSLAFGAKTVQPFTEMGFGTALKNRFHSAFLPPT
jgi:hypothetical protein